jgi:hypothetical protein
MNIMKSYLQRTFVGFILLVASGLCFLVARSQTSQPLHPPAQPYQLKHVSGITPPPIPAEQLWLRRAPNNLFWCTAPVGKTLEAVPVAPMTLEELSEQFRTNKFNLHLVILRDVELADPVTVDYTQAVRVIVMPVPKGQ